MDLNQIWRKIGEFKETERKINDVERKIRSLKNVSHHTEEFIDLSSGEAMIDLETAMKAEFAERKVKALQKQKMRLLVRRQDLIIDLEKIYDDLKREYGKQLIKMDLYFRKFVKELKKLRTLWNCMIGDGNEATNIHRCLWELRSLLDKNETIKTLPPYSRWKQDLERCFTILKNFEEVEKNG